MRAMLAQNGIPITTLEDRLRSNIAWTRLTQRRFAPQIDIGDEEVEEVIDRYRSNQGLPEYLLGEIFLAVDSPEEERQVRQFADQLATEINGMARRSRGWPGSSASLGGAASGGDMGWVVQGQLDPGARCGAGADAARPAVAAGAHAFRLSHLAGARSTPCRRGLSETTSLPACTGWHLAIPPGTSRSDEQRAIAVAEEASRTIRGCEALAERAEELGVSEPAGGRPRADRAVAAGDPVRGRRACPTGFRRAPSGCRTAWWSSCCATGTCPSSGLPSREEIADEPGPRPAEPDAPAVSARPAQRRLYRTAGVIDGDRGRHWPSPWASRPGSAARSPWRPGPRAMPRRCPPSSCSTIRPGWRPSPGIWNGMSRSARSRARTKPMRCSQRQCQSFRSACQRR